MVVYLATHGEKTGGPDPGMTEKGFQQVRPLRQDLFDRLPADGPPEVHIGTGKRQFEVASALGLTNLEERFFYSAVWGDGSSEFKRDGKPMVMLPFGRIIKWDQYLSPRHLQPAIRKAIMTLPDNTVICSGRPVLIRLGMTLNSPNCQSGALYAIHFKPGEPDSIRIELVLSGVNLDDGKGAAI